MTVKLIFELQTQECQYMEFIFTSIHCFLDFPSFYFIFIRKNPHLKTGNRTLVSTVLSLTQKTCISLAKKKKNQ